jgi:enamine deaminase RidA (YjgF/YER057c/UK114 family)
MDRKRRTLIRTTLSSTTGIVAGAKSASAEAAPSQGKKTHQQGPKADKTPLYSPAVSYGNLLFLSGKTAKSKGDIKSHAEYVLNEIQKELENAGSSMEKVLKVNVYLNDIKDFAAFNEVYLGKFGNEPPVRTTVAPMGGLPGETTVEIDCIAYI